MEVVDILFGGKGKAGLFKRKRIHQEISETHKTIVISVFGAQRGVGVTHTSLALARYFSKERMKVAYIEWGIQSAVRQLISSYEGIHPEEVSNEESYKIKRVDYFLEVMECHYHKIKENKYHVIIIDFGELNYKNLNAIELGDVKLLVGRANDWNYRCVVDKIKDYKDHAISWKVIIPYSKNSEIQYLNKQLEQRVYHMAYNQDPFRLEDEVERCFMDIMGR